MTLTFVLGSGASRAASAHAVWSDRHAIGAVSSHTRAPTGGIVTAEGGGFIPTLYWGGGGKFPRITGLSRLAEVSRATEVSAAAESPEVSPAWQRPMDPARCRS